MSEPVTTGRINPENGYYYTGVIATEAEVKAMRMAYNTPYVVIGGYLPASPAEVVHGVALHRGLPEIRGFYGFDFRTSEFIREADADQGEPDKWPSHKLSDVLGYAGFAPTRDTSKPPAIVEVLNAINPHKRDSGVCVTCGSSKVKPEDFESDLERREFEISQMCHECQVKAFAPAED